MTETKIRKNNNNNNNIINVIPAKQQFYCFLVSKKQNLATKFY